MGRILIQDEQVRETLRKMVSSITRNLSVQEELLQEALIHLWKMEADKPGRTQSWYVQSCWFHLQHWLSAGKSVDSPKRCRGQNRLLADETNLPEYHTNGENFERISFQDLVSTLGEHLRSGERAVLEGLAKGMELREICRTAGLSYPTALKYRRRIAGLVSKLESCSQDCTTPLMWHLLKPAPQNSRAPQTLAPGASLTAPVKPNGTTKRNGLNGHPRKLCS
jgi:DNA-directed RNA polymerase specialized sigma24 family protein